MPDIHRALVRSVYGERSLVTGGAQHDRLVKAYPELWEELRSRCAVAYGWQPSSTAPQLRLIRSANADIRTFYSGGRSSGGGESSQLICLDLTMISVFQTLLIAAFGNHEPSMVWLNMWGAQLANFRNSDEEATTTLTACMWVYGATHAPQLLSGMSSEARETIEKILPVIVDFVLVHELAHAAIDEHRRKHGGDASRSRIKAFLGKRIEDMSDWYRQRDATLDTNYSARAQAELRKRGHRTDEHITVPPLGRFLESDSSLEELCCDELAADVIREKHSNSCTAQEITAASLLAVRILLTTRALLSPVGSGEAKRAADDIAHRLSSLEIKSRLYYPSPSLQRFPPWYIETTVRLDSEMRASLSLYFDVAARWSLKLLDEHSFLIGLLWTPLATLSQQAQLSFLGIANPETGDLPFNYMQSCFAAADEFNYLEALNSGDIDPPSISHEATVIRMLEEGGLWASAAMHHVGLTSDQSADAANLLHSRWVDRVTFQKRCPSQSLLLPAVVNDLQGSSSQPLQRLWQGVRRRIPQDSASKIALSVLRRSVQLYLTSNQTLLSVERRLRVAGRYLTDSAMPELCIAWATISMLEMSARDRSFKNSVSESPELREAAASLLPAAYYVAVFGACLERGEASFPDLAAAIERGIDQVPEVAVLLTCRDVLSSGWGPEVRSRLLAQLAGCSYDASSFIRAANTSLSGEPALALRFALWARALDSCDSWVAAESSYIVRSVSEDTPLWLSGEAEAEIMRAYRSGSLLRHIAQVFVRTSDNLEYVMGMNAQRGDLGMSASRNQPS